MGVKGLLRGLGWLLSKVCPHRWTHAHSYSLTLAYTRNTFFLFTGVEVGIQWCTHRHSIFGKTEANNARNAWCASAVAANAQGSVTFDLTD